MNKKQVAALVIVLLMGGAVALVQVNDKLTTDNYRQLLKNNPSVNVLVLKNVSGNFEVLGRSEQSGTGFYRWKYVKDKTSFYKDSDLLDTAYWRVYNGTRLIRYFNSFEPDLIISDDSLNAIIIYEYFFDSYKTRKAGTLVRNVTLYPSTDNETITWQSADENARFNLRWVHDLDNGEVREEKSVLINSKGVKIDYSGSKSFVSKVSKGLKTTLTYKSKAGTQVIDPVVGDLTPSDWLRFRSDLYVGTKCELQQCRMCFDYTKQANVNVNNAQLKKHVTDLAREKNLTNATYDLKLQTYKLLNVTEWGKAVAERNITRSYTCTFSFNYTLVPKYAWCFISQANGSDNIVFEHAFEQGSITEKRVNWTELINVTEDAQVTSEKWDYKDISPAQFANGVVNAPVNDTGTICIAGKVNPGAKVDIFPEIFGYNYSEYATWNSSGWRYRVNITIQQTNVTYRKNNWNAPIDITLPGLRNASSADSIAFVDNASRQLAHDIEYFNNSINATHGRVVAWIKHFDWHNESDYAFQMWWNTSDPQNQENISGVWNDTSTSIRYQFVSHLGGNSTHAISDESGFKYSTQCYVAGSCPAFNTTTGLIGNSLYFDGTSGVWASGLNGTSLFGDAFWFSTWVHLNTGPSIIQYWAEAGKNADVFVSQYKPNAGNMRLHVKQDATSNNVDASDSGTVKDRWVIMTGNVDASGGILSFYENNTLLGSMGNSPDVSGVINTTFGFATLSTGGGAATFMTGLIDEVQIGSGAVTASDVQDRFEIEKNASAYFTLNATEDVNPPAPPPVPPSPQASVNVSLTNNTHSNASVITKSQQLFGYANYSNTVIGTLEANSTFKWFINNTNQSWGGGNKTTDLVPIIYKDAVGYWHLDENGGTNGYADSSGQGNTGTPFNGVANGTGVIKGAGQFDGVNDGISLQMPASLVITSNFSAEAWINLRNKSVDNSHQIIAQSLSVSPWERWSLKIGKNSNNVYFALLNSTSTTIQSTTSSSFNFNDSWNHVAGVFNGTHLTTYINGIQTSSAIFKGEINLTPAGTSTMSMGSWKGTGGDYRLNGSIDEVAIYNRSLTAEEVKQLYLRTWYDHSPEMLLAHLDNSSGSLINATDMGSHQPNASLNNGVNCTTSVTGYYGQACRFDGDDDSVSVPASEAHRAQDQMSIEAWINPITAGEGTFGRILDKSGAYNFRLQNGGVGFQLEGFIVLSTTSSDTITTTSATYNAWHHVAMVYNSNGSQYVDVYIDGERAATSTYTKGSGSLSDTGAEALIIGSNGVSGSRTFNGSIDEVRISRKALTAQEINLSFSKGRAYFQNEIMLNSSNYAKGDALVLEYFTKDTNQTNQTVNSSVVYVRNVIPTGSISFPTEGVSTSLNMLNATNLSDLDGDSMTCYWYFNDTFNKTGSPCNTTFSASMGNYVVNLSIYDGESFSANQSVNFNFDNRTSPSINISLNSYYTNRTYEFGTTAELFAAFNTSGSGRQICIDVNATGYLLNVTCGTETVYYNLTLNLLRHDKFNDSTTAKNFTGHSNFSVNLDNRTFLQNVTVNLTGFGNPENISVSINSSRPFFVLPGKLNGTTYIQDLFIYDNRIWDKHNVTFVAAGVKTFYLNLTTTDLAVTDLTFTLKGFLVDAGNELNYFQAFNTTDNNATSHINYSLGVNSSLNNATLGIWEDFNLNHSSAQPRFAKVSNLQGGGTCEVVEYVAGSSKTSCTSPTETSQTFYATGFDLRNVSRIDVDYNESMRANCQIGCGINANLVAFDGTSSQSFMEDFTTIFDSHEVRNLSLRKRYGTDTWDVYNGANYSQLIRTVTLTLSPTSAWNLAFFTRIYESPSGNVRTSTIYVHEIRAGGIINGKFGSTGYYNLSSFTSVPVDVTSNNVVAATINAWEISSGRYGSVNFTYELSNDLGANWVKANVGERTVLAGTGSQLIYRVNCTTQTSNDSCFLSKVNVQVAGGNAANVSVDFGADGVSDYYVSGNLSNTSITNGTRPVNTYITSNCKTVNNNPSFFCKVPVSVSSATGGVIEISGMNYSRNLSRFVLNKTLLDHVTNQSFLINFTQGTVQVNGLAWDYRGTGAVPVVARFYGDNTYTASSYARNITVKYSPFRVSLPANVSAWEVRIGSFTAKNVTPRGQTNFTPIFNVSSLAYDNSINLSVRLNHSLNRTGGDRINVTFSLNSSKTSNFLINTSTQFLTNISVNATIGIWNWIDVNATQRFATVRRIWTAICSECTRTFDYDNATTLVS